MEQIILSEKDIALIEKHLSGKYNPFFSTKEEQEQMNNLIDKATALEAELEAYDETAETDLLGWYLAKYKQAH